MWQKGAMRSGWVERLSEAIIEDGRSLRAISLDAGLGPNFAQQVVKRQRDPKAEPLGKLLNQLGDETAIYVMTGLKLSARDLAAVNRISQMPVAAQEAFELFLDRLVDDEDTQAPDAAQ